MRAIVDVDRAARARDAVAMSTHVDQFRAFADYNTRFNAQVYGHCDGLSDEERKKDRGAFFSSIHKTLGHILLADRIWLGRMSTCGVAAKALEGAALITSFGQLDDDLYPAWSDLVRERRATDAVLAQWTAALDDGALSVRMRYANSRGVVREHPAYVAIAHLFNHQTHHRGQVTTLLFQAGIDPGVTDFLAFAAPPVT